MRIKFKESKIKEPRKRILFFFIHLGHSFNFTVVYLCQIMGGILPPSGGIVGKNQSTRSKTTVRSKRGVP